MSRDDPTYDATARLPAMQGEPTEPTQPASPRPRGLIIAVSVTSALLAVALGVAGYLYWTTESWQREADELKADKAELEAMRADLEQQVRTLQDNLAATEAQLEASNDRLSELASEQARTADEREIQRRLAEQNAELAQQQHEIALAAADAAAKLSVCASGQDQLIDYIVDIEQYDQAQIIAFAQQVDADCKAAADASVALNDLLDGSG